MNSSIAFTVRRLTAVSSGRRVRQSELMAAVNSSELLAFARGEGHHLRLSRSRWSEVAASSVSQLADLARAEVHQVQLGGSGVLGSKNDPLRIGLRSGPRP